MSNSVKLIINCRFEAPICLEFTKAEMDYPINLVKFSSFISN